jgi:hypothetical protein
MTHRRRRVDVEALQLRPPRDGANRDRGRSGEAPRRQPPRRQKRRGSAWKPKRRVDRLPNCEGFPVSGDQRCTLFAGGAQLWCHPRLRAILRRAQHFGGGLKIPACAWPRSRSHFETGRVRLQPSKKVPDEFALRFSGNGPKPRLHKGEILKGEQVPILDRDLFDAVNAAGPSPR